MIFVLNILASPPEGDVKKESDSRDGNLAVLHTKEMMQSVENGQWLGHDGKAEEGKGVSYKPVLRRAAFVRDIAKILKDFKDPQPDIIQIIGHGSPGRVQLGSYWTEPKIDPVYGHAELDSNPDSYGMLKGLFPAKARVFLLGCNIGSDSPSGYVASGRALLFDLEDMSGANFYAADDLVSPMDFDDGFLYSGSLIASNGRIANPAALVRNARGIETSLPGAPNDTDEQPLATLPVNRIVSAPALGVQGTSIGDSSRLLALCRRYVPAANPPKGLLAMPELIVETQIGRGEVIANMRYIRVFDEDGKTTQYFEAPSSGGQSDVQVGEEVAAWREEHVRSISSPAAAMM